MPDPQLRPLQFGEVLDAAFALYRRHFRTMFLTALPAFAVFSLLSGGITGAQRAATDPVAWVLFFGTAMIGFFLIWAMLAHESADAFLDQPVDVREAFGRAVRSFFPLLFATILVYAGIFLTLLLFALLSGIVAAVAAGSGTSLSAGLAMPILIGGLIGLLMVAIGLWIFASSFAVLPLIVVERAGVFAALRRSWALSRGARLRIIGVLLVAWLITVLPMFGAMMLAGMGTAIVDPEAMATLSSGQTVFYDIVSTLSGALTMPFFVATMVVLYFDRKVRAEGFDLEWEARQLAVA